ncbi:tripartite tricarboxylate transporter TctB family protein [Arthrobacter castelli]|uniref:tripartite tricarboxylate transporter TctB family protein n=1 Tax=Arthrobacter castelli TaxID=271431 RepID=UPI00041A6904|nr:tripartite tricarboxylate transporter TctB family protein [Arthrobacter castelli]
MTRNPGDRVAAVILLALAVFVFAYSFTMPDPVQELDPGVAAFPRGLAVLIGVLALVPLFRPQPGEALPRGLYAGRVIGTVALLAGYAMVLDIIGFVITTVAFTLAELFLLGIRRPVTLIVMPLGVGLGLFYVFRTLLGVALPTSGLGGLPI